MASEQPPSAMPPCATVRVVAHLSRSRRAFAWKQIGPSQEAKECRVQFRPKDLPAGQSVPSRTIPGGGIDLNSPTAAPEFGMASEVHFTRNARSRSRLDRRQPAFDGVRAEGIASACAPSNRRSRPKRQRGGASRVWPAIPATPVPKRLRTFRPLDTGDKDRGTDFQDLAELEEHLDGRRLLVEFEQADVVARNAGACRKFFLRHFRPEPFIAEFIAKHGTRLKLASRRVCQL